MAKYTYYFVAEKDSKSKYLENTIEISDEWAAVLATLDKEDKCNNRRETRRHYSMDGLLEKGFKIRDYKQDLDFVLEWKEYYCEERELERLQRQVFAKYLTEKQANIFYRYEVLRERKVKIAKDLNITEGAVRKHILTAEDKLYDAVRRVAELLEIDTEELFDSEGLFEGSLYLHCLLRLQ